MIGVFDSGYGGLTILKALQKALPKNDFLYLGDNARAPYGNRSFETIYKYTLQAVTKMFELGCPIVILACNTASARALRTIQQNDLAKLNPNNRVLGIIRPCTESIGFFSETSHVGLVATKGTVRSNSYPIETKKFFPDLTLVSKACPMLVPLVENNELKSDGSLYFVKKYLDDIIAQDANVDTILLACTHYPLLKELFEESLPSTIKVVEQGKIVAHSLVDYLDRHPEMSGRLSKNSKTLFYTSEETENFLESAKIFYSDVIQVEHIEWN